MLCAYCCEEFISQSIAIRKDLLLAVENSDLPYLCPWYGFVMYEESRIRLDVLVGFYMKYASVCLFLLP